MRSFVVDFCTGALICFVLIYVSSAAAATSSHPARSSSSVAQTRVAWVVDAQAGASPVFSKSSVVSGSLVGNDVLTNMEEVAPSSVAKRSLYSSARLAREETQLPAADFFEKAVEDHIPHLVAQLVEAAFDAPEGNSAADAMMIKMNGDGDTAALASSAIFTMSICLATIVAFCVLRLRYPEIYSHRVAEGTAPPGQLAIGGAGYMDWIRDSHSLTADEVIPSAGLDTWMFLELQALGSQMCVCMCPVAFVLLTLHWFNGGKDSTADYLSRLSLSVVSNSNLMVIWIHAAVVWFVVLVAMLLLFLAQRRFLVRRYDWLRAMPEPQATTLLVEGIPEAYRSDKSLRAYFVDMFSEQAILSVYVVRNTRRLLALQSQLQSSTSKLKKVEQQWASAGSPPDQRPKIPLMSGLQVGEDAIVAYARQQQELEEAVASERKFIATATSTADPLVCSSTGFVTFSTRRDARMASREQLRSDDGEFILLPAPHPADVLYDNLLDSVVESMIAPAPVVTDNPDASPESADGQAFLDKGATDLAEAGRYLTRLIFSQELHGWICIMALFAAWTPLVILISGLTSLNALQTYIPALIAWLKQFPIITAAIDGILATFGLNILMAILPWLLLVIVERFFKLKAGSWAQLWLERLYFVFLFFFVLLVTALGRGIFETLAAAANNPSSVLALFARTLPMASHFYVGYVMTNWFSTCAGLLRLGPLFKYFSFKALMDNEEARKRSEPESVYPGPRVSMSAITLVIALVFASLSPLICMVAWMYFKISHTSYGYLCCFAEPKQPDLGGVFWVTALKQIHSGLFVYVLLMLGVISAHSDGHPGPFVFVLPTLLFLAVAWRRFDSQFLWENLPLEELVRIDESRKASGASQVESAGSYVQPECRPSGQFPGAECRPLTETE